MLTDTQTDTQTHTHTQTHMSITINPAQQSWRGLKIKIIQISFSLYFCRQVRKSAKSNLAADDVAVPDDAFLTQYKDFSLQNAISSIEGRLEKGEEEEEEDVLPSAAAEMGSGQCQDLVVVCDLNQQFEDWDKPRG